ncbi:DUF177 domain-containing protein [Apibacter muscae]|uniref:DUF177 domain-containing protein n=1 Tax=Apibacter muscae TaxID=2509004 RepID=A0A563DCD0_9FLAO|nr:DUF177 domain-containing protein [Apibacter muscae]TWP27434.1 DUF177 domain-containing protein [Apibacter muscae]TWP28850.1 DUF177 domain-containing protein [Apibacter muscae]
MDKLSNYDISLHSLKLGNNAINLVISQHFFDLFDFNQEFSDPNVNVNINIVKHSSFFELNMDTIGTVILRCDISDDEYEQQIKNSIKILVKFGEEFNDENEEILVLPHGSHSLNIAQFAYEAILLSIPMKRIHPRYLNGHEDKYTELLDKYSLPNDSISNN